MNLFSIFLFLGTMAISLWAAARVKSVYHRYSQIPAASGATGAEVAAAILDRAGIHDVEIVSHDEMLGDHLRPGEQAPGSFRSELSRQLPRRARGRRARVRHAIQHKIAYGPLHWRMAAVGATNFASQIVMFLPFLGFFTSISYHTIGWVMAIAWGVIMLFNLITLPVEFDASNRAKKILGGMGFIGSEEEMRGVRKTLDAAGWTYVARVYYLTGLSALAPAPLILGGRRSD